MPLLRRPREPGPGECCGNGCARCVWDVYYDALAAYEAQQASVSAEEEYSQEETSEETGSEIDNYIGSVVVRYLSQPVQVPSPAFPSNRTDLDLVREIDASFQQISEVKMVKTSLTDSNFSTPQGVFLLDLVRSSDAGIQTAAIPGDVVDVFVPNCSRRFKCWGKLGHSHDRSCGGNSINGASASSSGSSAWIYQDPVREVCALLHVDPEQWCELHRSPFVPENCFPPWLPLRIPMTVRQLLTYYVDLSTNAFLHHSFFESLLRLYENSHPSSRSSDGSPESSDNQNGVPLPNMVSLPSPFLTPHILQQCASPEHSGDIIHQLKHSSVCFPTIHDFLRIFSFTSVPFDRFLEISCPLRPRKFSVVKEHFMNVSPTYPSSSTEEGVQEKRKVLVTRLCMRESYLCPQFTEDSLMSSTPPHTEGERENPYPETIRNTQASPLSSSAHSSSSIVSDAVKCIEHSWKAITMQRALEATSSVDSSSLSSYREVGEGTEASTVNAPTGHGAYAVGHVSGPLIQQSFFHAPSSPTVLSSFSSTPTPTTSHTGIYLGNASFGAHPFARALSSAVNGILASVPASMLQESKPLFPKGHGRKSLYLMGMGTGMAPLMSAVYALQKGWKQLSASLSAVTPCPLWEKYPSASSHPSLLSSTCSSCLSSMPHPWFDCRVWYGSRNRQELIFHDDLLAGIRDQSLSSYTYVLSREASSFKPFAVFRREDDKKSRTKGVDEKEASSCLCEEKHLGGAPPHAVIPSVADSNSSFRHITDLLENDTEEKRLLKQGLLTETASVFACGPPVALEGLRKWFLDRLLPSSCCGEEGLVASSGACDSTKERSTQSGSPHDIFYDLVQKNQIVFERWNSWN